MKVLLVQDVDNLGLAGEIRNVADGYGRNYLIPRGLAVVATEGAMKQADMHRRRASEKRQRVAQEMMELAERVRQTTLTFQAKAGDRGRLYGSITTADIAEKLSEALDQEIDRRKIQLEGTIKQLGTHEVILRLSGDIMAGFNILVEPIESEEAPEQIGVAEEAPAIEDEAAG